MDDPLPRDWPALMDLATVSAYLALAPGSVASLLRRENIFPVELGGRFKRWRRSDLDALIARLPARGAPAEPACQPLESGVDWALAAVERRSSTQRRRSASRRPGEVRQPHPAA
jgi:predicted DNA-binding transcriptional regulator AlpA